MFELIIQTLLKAVYWAAKKDLTLPLFNSQLLFQTMEEGNPQIFFISVTNRSKENFIINKAFIMKRNGRTNSLITFINAKLLAPSQEITHSNINLQNINECLAGAKEINHFELKSKKSMQIFVFAKLDSRSHEYWKNFELKMIPGFIDDEGKTYPAWSPPEFSWEFLLGDEKGFYWTSHAERVAFQILQNKYRNQLQIERSAKRRDNILPAILRSSLDNFRFSINYIFVLLLIKAHLRDTV